jgi:hypothetical protein
VRSKKINCRQNFQARLIHLRKRTHCRQQFADEANRHIPEPDSNPQWKAKRQTMNERCVAAPDGLRAGDEKCGEATVLAAGGKEDQADN